MGMVADDDDNDVHRVGQQMQIKDAGFQLERKGKRKGSRKGSQKWTVMQKDDQLSFWLFRWKGRKKYN